MAAAQTREGRPASDAAAHPADAAGDQAATLDAALRHPVFIVGSPRSGTSALTSALLRSGYHGFHEGNFLTLLHGIEDLFFRQIKAFGKPDARIMASQVDWETLRGEIQAAVKAQVDRLNPKAPWLDKTGNADMIQIIPVLMQLWPNACFIFAKRRAIENIISRQQKFPKFDFEYHCQAWAKIMFAWRKMRDLEGLPAIEIDQQDIAQRPEEVARKIAAFLGGGEDFGRRVETAFAAERPQESQSGSAKRVMSLEETGWSRDEIEIFRERCGGIMKFYGYSFDASYWMPARPGAPKPVAATAQRIAADGVKP